MSEITVNVNLVIPASVLQTIARIESGIRSLGGQMALDYSKLQAALQKDTDAQNAAVTLINQLAVAVADLKTKITDPAAQQTLDDFAAQLTSKADALATAVVANTPAEAQP